MNSKTQIIPKPIFKLGLIHQIFKLEFLSTVSNTSYQNFNQLLHLDSKLAYN